MQKFIKKNNTIKPFINQEWKNGLSVEELRINLLKKVNIRWNEKLAADKNFVEKVSFEDRWAKGIPLEEARIHLLKTAKGLFEN